MPIAMTPEQQALQVSLRDRYPGIGARVGPAIEKYGTAAHQIAERVLGLPR